MATRHLQMHSVSYLSPARSVNYDVDNSVLPSMLGVVQIS